jgi:gliding motility-associated-like protein
MKRLVTIIIILHSFSLYSQIIIDNLTPYDSSPFLVDNILLGGGVIATNHIFQGEPSQIGWFDAVNTNLGIDSGIVMCTGDIYALDPINMGFGGAIPNTVTDPDLLAVANSVPGLIGQTFTVSSINDVAVLEFDFIPTSDSLEFRYAFGSQEYFTYENTQFNDVFGFFLSGPGIAGPWDNGAINLAVVPNTNPPLPITISSVCNDDPDIMNPEYFIANQGTGLDTIADADGFTTVLTAQALVQCGETYHIKLAIADGSDGGLSSYVWLEAGSFFSPPLSVVDDLSIDSTLMDIPCNATITLTADGGIGSTYEWFDSTSTVFSTSQSVTVSAGQYVVLSDINGCAVLSDTLTVIADPAPNIDLGLDLIIACNSDTLINPLVSSGTPPYSFLWNSGGSNSMMLLTDGQHIVNVSDSLGCEGSDTLLITYDAPPNVDLGLDYNIPCNTNTMLFPNTNGGTPPYTYLWNTGSIDSSISIGSGNYIVTVSDLYNCTGSGSINIIEDIAPTAIISGGGAVCADSSAIINFTFSGLLPWDLTYTDGSLSYNVNNINSNNYTISTIIPGNYNIILSEDVNDCIASVSEVDLQEVIINPLPVAEISPDEITIYSGDEVVLNVGNFDFYEWFNEYDSLISINESIIVQDSGRYKVWVEDQNGCTDMSEFAIIRLVPLTQLFVPTIFTPNNDEHNELFVIKGKFVEMFNIKIFDRWGAELFASDSIDKYWDGSFNTQRVPQGTYFYQIYVVGTDGVAFEKSGPIEVLY